MRVFILAEKVHSTIVAMADKKDAAQASVQGLPIKAGQLYRHFKGGEYEVLAVALKEDTLEPVVIYRSFLKGYIWARTLQNWNEEVETGGKRVKRFEEIE